MPRHRRVSPDGYVQHVLNRGDHRETIFFKPGDFRAFLGVVAESAQRLDMRILAYCIMRNHFHLVVWPQAGQDLPVFMQVLMNLHIPRYLRHYRPESPGHIYQGRYTNSIVQSDHHVLRVLRYVEANARSAGLVLRAEDYKWSSASPYSSDPGRPKLSEGPVPKPADWLAYVNARQTVREMKAIRQSASRGAPYGAPKWVTRVADAHDLTHTLRSPGRPISSKSSAITEASIAAQ
jgi:putative transposase